MFDHDAPTVPGGSVGPVADRAARCSDHGSEGPEEQLTSLLNAVRRLASSNLAGLAPGAVNRMLATQRRLDAAMSAWRSSLVAACDETVLERAGAVDKVGLVRDRLGMTGREAKKEAALAEGLEELPGTREALREGRIGADHARRIASAVEDGALGSGVEVEGSLLDAAQRLDADRFGRHVRRKQEEARSAAEQHDRDLRAHRRRTFSMRDRGDGLTELWGLLPTLPAAQLETALAAFTTLDGEDVPEEERRSGGQRQADAFIDLVQAGLSAPRDGSVGRARSDVTVMIPWHVFAGGDGVAEVNGRIVSGELARQAACDADISRLLAGPTSQPLDIGRASKDWTVAQRKAIVARDGHCRFPACDRPAAWCHAHHIQWWKRDHGPTSVDNGLLLCQRHHTAVHVGGWKVSLDASTGVATWTSPRGERRTTHPEGALHTLLGSDPPPRAGPEEDPARRPAVARERAAHYVAWPVAPRLRSPDDHRPTRLSDQLALAGTTSRAP